MSRITASGYQIPAGDPDRAVMKTTFAGQAEVIDPGRAATMSFHMMAVIAGSL